MKELYFNEKDLFVRWQETRNFPEDDLPETKQDFEKIIKSCSLKENYLYRKSLRKILLELKITQGGEENEYGIQKSIS